MNQAINTGQKIDVEDVIDSARIGPFLITIVALCAIVALLDGFDTLAISYVAPVIAGSWDLPKEAFGPIFAAHYAGAALGAAIFGMLADHYGRRPVIITATGLFGIFALLTPFTYDFLTLFILRGLTGLGLGGALSNVIALVAEYAPSRRRATLVSIMYAAFPLGGVLGGPLSAHVVQNHGWKAVFVIGGITPLVLLLFLIFALPESIRLLVVRGAPSDKIAKLLHRVSPSSIFSAEHRFVIKESFGQKRLAVREIFSKGFLKTTLLLCLASFVTQLVIVYVITWMPTLLKSAGLPLSRAIIASATFSLGGIVGSLLLARIIDKQKSYRSLVLAFMLAAVAIGLIGFITFSFGGLIATVCLSGIMIVGAQVNLSAYSATVYPTHIRSTGLGYIIGIGRIGAIAGALVGTLFVTAGLTLSTQYVLAGMPAVIAGLAVYFAQNDSASAVDAQRPATV